jgi:hypothetical protein
MPYLAERRNLRLSLLTLWQITNQRVIPKTNFVPEDKAGTYAGNTSKREKDHRDIQKPMSLIETGQPDSQCNNARHGQKQHSQCIHNLSHYQNLAVRLGIIDQPVHKRLGLICKDGHSRAHTFESKLFVKPLSAWIGIQDYLFMSLGKLYQFGHYAFANTSPLIIRHNSNVTDIGAVNAIRQHPTGTH